MRYSNGERQAAGQARVTAFQAAEHKIYVEQNLFHDHTNHLVYVMVVWACPASMLCVGVRTGSPL